jgi:hypothetical protein
MLWSYGRRPFYLDSRRCFLCRPYGMFTVTALAAIMPVSVRKTKAGDTLSSRHVSSRDVTSAVGIFNIEFWRKLTLLSTLFTSRDLTWSSGRLTCQHASHISVVIHISWDVAYVSSALQHCYQLFPEIEEMLIEKVRQRTFLYDTKWPDYRDQHMRANAWEEIGKEL